VRGLSLLIQWPLLAAVRCRTSVALSAFIVAASGVLRGQENRQSSRGADHTVDVQN
jgi:hypothetical protein